MRNRNWWAIAVSTVIIAAACSNGAAPPAPARAPAATTAASHAAATATAGSQATATAAAPASAPASAPTAASFNPLPSNTGYKELDAALGADQPYKGKAVNIQVQWTGGELANFQATVAPFAKASGIAINVDSVPSSHETVLKSRIEGGSPPDIAQLAQPTPVLAYAAEGKVIDLATFMDTQ